MCLLKMVQKRQYRLKTITCDETSLQVILQHALFFSWQLFAIDITL